MGCHGFTISIQYDNYHACLKTQLVTQPFSEQRKIILDIVKWIGTNETSTDIDSYV